MNCLQCTYLLRSLSKSIKISVKNTALYLINHVSFSNNANVNIRQEMIQLSLEQEDLNNRKMNSII